MPKSIIAEGKTKNEARAFLKEAYKNENLVGEYNAKLANSDNEFDAAIIDANAATSQENAAISDELINCANALKTTVDEYNLREDAEQE